ncbi:ABC-F family ATP-binding cassette domain-containing protein [Nesterenkonia muleiensis]|uniref:ABC-F family ATP-binding cassette domain-containing protein n=1 Tax=Nesterenkonia muleiensis TaxID=2282648 RepID=UPI000E756E81|nr:ABC-F family ATP-binding cassette domain-containing protein [Nesterenkonia muleiensis]
MTYPNPHSASAHLRADGISVAFAGRRVLTDISFTVSSRERAALIGENGSGKSTLLRVLAGLLEPDAGTVQATALGTMTPRIGLLHQVPPFASGHTVAQALEAAVAPVRAAERALAQAADEVAEQPESARSSSNYSRALETAERLGIWEIDARIDAAVDGLGLGRIPRSRETGSLSGGQQARLSLAWLLLNNPEFLLLDEPTNHLDDDAVAYLRATLRDWRGPVLFASHDRAFLDESATTLIDLDPSPLPQAVAGPLVADGIGSGIGVTRFTGSYTEYLQARFDARDRWWQQHRDEQAELKRLRAAVRDSHTVGHHDWTPRSEGRAAQKFYADRNAKVVSRRVNDAQRRLEELEQQQIRKPPRELSFGGLTAGGNGAGRARSGPILSTSAVTVEGRLQETSLSIAAGEKWLVTGPNGSGKSTLLELLAGALAPSSGAVHRPRSLRIGVLTQDHELPDPQRRGPGRTAKQTYEDLVGITAAQRVPLGTFGLIAGRDENRPVAELSVGQQRRLALAAVLAEPPDLLLLDEPTNHFSLLLATQLEAAIPDYPGTVVVASHDRWLRRTWQSRRLVLTTS